MDDGKQMKKFELDKLPSWKNMKVEALRIGLEGVEVFGMLDDETKEKEWNGIGSDAMSERLRNILDWLFTEALSAACIHDFRFVIGGSKDKFYATNAELKRNLYKCLRYYRRNYSLIGYWTTKIKINIAVWLCNKYGYKGWRNKEDAI